MRYAILLALFASTADAQVRPQPGSGDPRLQTVEYRRDQVVAIDAAVGYQVTIALAPDEQVQNAAVGDAGAWQVSVNRAGNLLFVKPTQEGANTNLTVVTNARSYAFDLRVGGGDAPFEVRFRYPATAVSPYGPAASEEAVGYYRLSGSKPLRPARMSDDGQRTYIDWPAEVALPAVFAIDARGRETLANGNMRDGLYVIDGVQERLIFRLDDRIARAHRVAPRGKRR